MYKEGEENDAPIYSEVVDDQDKTPLLKHTSLIKKVREMLIIERDKYPESEQESKYFSEMIKEKVRNKINIIGLGVIKKERDIEKKRAKIAELDAYEISQNSHEIGLKYARDFNKNVSDNVNKLKTENAELKDMATKDSLTGIYNRGFLMELGEKVASETKREIIDKNHTGGNLGALMIDIDFFKDINDNFGHQIGDSAIISVVKIIENNINRGGDVLGRYGGEEFLLFLPKTNIDGSIAVGEKLRKAIEGGLKNLIENELRKKLTGNELDKKIRILDKNINGTISIGISCLNEGNNVDMNGLINQADIALYSAKDMGRNQVAVSELIKNNERDYISIYENTPQTEDEVIIKRKLGIGNNSQIIPEKAVEA